MWGTPDVASRIVWATRLVWGTPDVASRIVGATRPDNPPIKSEKHSLDHRRFPNPHGPTQLKAPLNSEEHRKNGPHCPLRNFHQLFAPRLARLVVFVLDLLAGADFEGFQRPAHRFLADLEDGGLILAVVVGVLER